MTLRFEWQVFVTPSLLAELRAAAGIDAAEPLDALVPLIARCLAAAGGLPLWRGAEPDEATRTAWGRRLLHEALGHATSGQLRRSRPSGLTFETSSNAALAALATAWPMVEVNVASAAELDALPGIGRVIAERIVSNRIARGPYASPAELAERIEGLGPQRLHRLRSVISYAHPQAMRWAPRASGELATDLPAMLQMQPGATPLERLQGLLERTASVCSGRPAPATRARRIREPLPPQPQTTHQAEWVSALFGSDYVQQLPPLFAAATSRIEVLMFHIALPGAAHPTRTLLDALIAAQARGVAVRVLLDRDRESDPYRSSVINTAAARLLKQGGVAVRFDSREQLLHSKAIAIDDALVVLGSHNWSAGSYFGFDDLSLALRAPALALQFRERFDSLWEQGEALPD